MEASRRLGFSTEKFYTLTVCGSWGGDIFSLL